MEWISAFEAYQIVSERNRSFDAAKSIAERACAGHLRTRAERLVWQQPAKRGELETESLDETGVPKKFWWAEGGSALEQNWDAGDFTTWIDGKFKWQAFGVKFERAGIEAMLAPLGPQPELTEKPADNNSDKGRSRPSVKSRSLTHNHPYVAAKTVFDLMNLPDSERSRLTGPSVGMTMRNHYEQNSGHPPHADNLDEYGESVLRALREYWLRQSD